jgi:hypothetical protein
VLSSVRSTLAALAIGASGLRSSCESMARNWPCGAPRAAAAGALGRATPRAPFARGCRRSCRRSRSRHRRHRSEARRCRASSGTGRRGGAGAGPWRRAPGPRSWWHGWPRQRSRSSGWDGAGPALARGARRRCGPYTPSTTAEPVRCTGRGPRSRSGRAAAAIRAGRSGVGRAHCARHGGLHARPGSLHFT